jgi:type VI secretion system protein ImpC
MTDWLDRLLIALRQASVDLTPEDVADVVWLAPYLDTPTAGAEIGVSEPAAEPPAAKPAAPPGELQEDRPQAAPAQEWDRNGFRRGAGHRAALHLPGDGETGKGGRPLRAPTGAALPGSLALARALRPLRRRVPSRTGRALDVAETVRRIAEERIWLPALRPARDRWLELALVVDVGPSMGPWRATARELLALLACMGAFRAVRVWNLDTDARPLRLRAGLAHRPGAPGRDPRELVDPAGRSLVVVLTDGVADAWSDGTAARLLETWSRSGPVALLLTLPEQLWPRTALAQAAAVRLAAPGPAAPNARLDAWPLDHWCDLPERPASPLPVASLVPQALAAWARLVAGVGGAQAAGFVLALEPPPPPATRPRAALPPSFRLARFWRVASPTARRLAGLLAAAPVLSLPIIRLIRTALVPEARQVHEAEILLGGLLRVVAERGAPVPDPDEVRYDFRDGLRPLLLDAVPSADALTVLERVSSFVEEHLEHGLDFRAVLADPTSARGTLVPDESPFARVAAEVLLRLGGDYARLVAALPADGTATAAGVGAPSSSSGSTIAPPGRLGAAPELRDPPLLPGAAPARSESLQHRLGRVRAPRVQITYDAEVGGAIVKRELPFVIGVLADLSGHPGGSLKPLRYRKFATIDRDNFEIVMRAVAPRLSIPVGDPRADAAPWPVKLVFLTVRDFEPHSIAEQCPGMRGRQIREIIHHPDFQRLEAAWRGLRYLVHQTETSGRLKIRVLDVSKRELFQDLYKSVEFDQSALFKKVHEESYGTVGGEPFGLLIGDYEFSHQPEDVTLLGGISRLAAVVHAPFVAAASSAMFKLGSFAEMAGPRDLSKVFASIEYAKWRAFRDSEDSRYTGLTLPRVLARLPYGAEFKNVAQFGFEEVGDGKTHEEYLWMNAAWAYAARVADAYAQHGWMIRTRGADGGGKVERLPVHTFRTDEGDVAMTCSTEIALSNRREYELASLGFLTLVQIPWSDSVAFLSAQSCHKPKRYDSDAANASSRSGARLDVLLCISRFIQYVKVMARDRIGSFMGREEIESWLNRWIQHYVTFDPDASPETTATRPLAEARIDISEAPGQPGTFRAILYLRPVHQLEEPTTPLRVVVELPKSF